MCIDRPDEDGVALFGAVDVGGVIEKVEMVDGDVTGCYFVGGLVGRNDGTVSDSYATSNVTSNYHCVGGLVGGNGATVTNSYSTGNVTGDGFVGGLVGLHHKGTVDSSYATGSVTGVWSVGGLVGLGGNVDVSNSFWDTQTSGQGSSAGGTGKNTAEMQDIDTFTDTETQGLDEPWDIIAVDDAGERNPAYVWNIVDDETYSFLSWQP